jgi:hypothetical protein
VGSRELNLNVVILSEGRGRRPESKDLRLSSYKVVQHEICAPDSLS